MLRLRPPSHTPIEINDTKILRFHIAILKKKTQNEDGQGDESAGDDLHADDDNE
jgi:hypothetical protein